MKIGSAWDSKAFGNAPHCRRQTFYALATVIPAQAGIQHRRTAWIPACAGMTHGLYFAVGLGWLSSTLTASLPSAIAFSAALTLATISAGTFFSKVPSGASSEPLCFIVE